MIKEWNDLTKDQKIGLIDFADSIGIPPNFVQTMYENGMIEPPEYLNLNDDEIS